ncbi:MAG: hypothetical protein NTX33_04735 [Propionibacteriales bacterium]|nr:hypothetical protein [Propionibacteriales bacterium]
MRQDSRDFTVKVAPDDSPVWDRTKLWRALDALEKSVYAAGPEGGRGVHETVRIDHATGNYTRPNVEQAKETAELHGYHVSRVGVEFQLQADGYSKPTWVKASTWDAYFGRHLKVEVMYGTELEVNGTYTMVREAVEAATRDAIVVAKSANKQVSVHSAWVVLTTHPMIVTIVGTVIAALILAFVFSIGR